MRLILLAIAALMILGSLALWRAIGDFRTGGQTVPGPTNQTAASPEDVQAALAPYQQALEATRRPSMRIVLEDHPADDPMVSKVGGSAWWPEGQAGPAGQGGVGLVLLAQINFSEMPASADYPGKGLLQFFIAPDDYYGANFDSDFSMESLSRQLNFRVHYWPDTSVPAGTLKARADTDFMTPHTPDKPRRMRFVAGDEVLSSSDYRFDALLGGNAYETLEAWAAANGKGQTAIDDVFLHLDGGGHKFGGYPYFTQSDPRTEGRFELLLQLDTDEHMMWGDAGVGGFFIDPADLARGDFSRVMYNWDCH